MDEKKVGLIITSRSNKEQLARCVEFVYTQKYDGQIQTIVVDNASTDNSVFILSSRYPQIKIIQNKVNFGIGTAVNQGIYATDAPYIAVLHQDVEIEENWVSLLVRALESDPKIGSACSMVTYRRSKGSKIEIDSAGIGFRQGVPVRLAQGADMASPRLSEAHPIFGVPGSAAMYKREMLENIKLGNEIFDEDLFACCEDYDVAMRAYMHGYTSIFAPGTAALHKRGILREHDVKAQQEREILEACAPILLLIKCLPLHIWDKHKRRTRRGFYKRILGLMGMFDIGVAAQAWNHYRLSRKKMFKKQMLLFEGLDVNLEAIEWEVFGKK